VLKHLNVDEMVALVAPWVDKKKRQDVFLSIPEIAPLHAKVVQAHDGVLAVRPAKSPSPQLAGIIEEETLVDARHDHYARGIHLALEAHAQLFAAKDPPDFARAAKCQEAIRKLFPTGLTIVNASLLAESGNTARVGKLLRDQEKALGEFLDSIPALEKKKSLRDMVDGWIEAGTRLAELEHARTELLAKEVAKSPPNASPQAARSLWLRVVSQVLSNLELSDAPASAIEVIRGPVERAAERAERRYASDKNDEPVVQDEGQEAAKGDVPAQPSNGPPSTS
jgi:hypothetical protein